MEWIDLLREAAPVLLQGAGYTLVFALASMVGGLAIGVPVALMRIALLKTLRWPATLYVSLIPR
jgi:cystine transport system permease protein